MSLPTSRLAYSDCYEALDKAIADEFGLRIKLRTESECINLRMRMNQARKLDRDDNAKIYIEADHPMHGRSPYDKITCRIRQDYDGVWWLYLEQQMIKGEMEALSDLPDQGYLPPPATPEYLPPQRLEAPPAAPLQIEHIKRRL